jgi:hypothetical protein
MKVKEIAITRNELFEKVWTTPISKLAVEYGLSDVGLAKICKRMEIPRPARGYWQKLEGGKAPSRPKLKPLTPRGMNKVVINPNRKIKHLKNIVIETGQIPCPDKLEDEHPLTLKTIRALKTAKTGERGILIPRNKIYLDIRVTRDCVNRACLIMDTLMKGLVDRDYELTIEKDDSARTIVSVEGESIEIGIDEKIRAVDHVITPKEKAEYGGYIGWTPRYDHLPTGELTLKIRNATYLGVRQTWADGKVQKLEDCLGKFITGMHHAAQAIKEHRLERERQELEWEEKNRRWKERQRLEHLENQKIEKLLDDVNNWRLAENIRGYLKEIRKLKGEVEGLDGWIDWACCYVDKIDPLKSQQELVFVEKESSVIF